MKLLADLSPLRSSPPFRRLWAGSTLSAVGGALTSFAVTLQVYDITRSPVAVGLIGVAIRVPLLTVGLLGGTFIDAGDKRSLTSPAISAFSGGLLTVLGAVVIGAALPVLRRYSRAEHLADVER